MGKSIDEYLRIIYPNLEQLSQEEKLKFEKDKAFLLAYLKEFEEFYKRFENARAKMGDQKFFSIALQLCKEDYDKETIIAHYIDGMDELLGNNSYITQNYDEFMGLMNYERQQGKSLLGVESDKTPIGIDKVFELTEEFLNQIDPSGEMAKELRNMMEQGRIRFLFPDGKNNKSNYDKGIINYAFDGTLETANGLVHEFMHHWTKIKADLNDGRVDHTMFNEFESIYYENAFIRFMNNKGLLKNGENPLLVTRLKRQYEKDPNNSVLMLLELYKLKLDNKEIDKESIVETLQKYFPGIKDKEELWKKISETLYRFCKDNYFPGETVNGPVMYRFNTALAMKTSLDPKTMTRVHKLVPFIKGRTQDGDFMEQYKRMRKEIISERTSEDIDKK